MKLHDGWIKYAALYLPPDATEQHCMDVKLAYYSGALGALKVLRDSKGAFDRVALSHMASMTEEFEELLASDMAALAIKIAKNTNY